MAHRFWFVVLVLLLGTAGLFAGTTGKIAGVIRDGDTGEPLIGVNIQVLNTTLGASTDVDGYFVILNVPPGLYTVELSYIGYQPVRIRDVRVNVDFTTEINQTMSVTTVEADAVEVYGERNPLVRQDLTNTQVAVTSEEIAALPVDAISDVIALQAGVVVDNSGALHIRGGRSNEIAFQVNGLGINNPFGNSQGVGIATNAVEEVSVSAGTFSAEYGNALSGVINFVTKDGGPQYKTSLKAWSGDHLSSRDDIFFNIDEIDPLNNRRAEWTLSGPVPLLGKQLTFFVSGVFQENDGHLYGQRIYNTEDWLSIDGDRIRVDPFGLSFQPGPNGTVTATADPSRAGASGDGEIVPMVTSKSLNMTGKLTWKALNNLKLTYDIIFDDGERYSSSYFRRYRFTPDGRPRSVSNNVSHSFGMTHTLSKTFFYTMKFGLNISEAQTSVFDDRIDPRLIPVPQNDINTLLLPNAGFQVGGMNLDWVREEATTQLFKMDAVWQVLPNHELKFGGEYARHNLDLESFSLLFDFDDARFFIPDPETNPGFTGFSAYEREPVQAAFYILDKMELSKRFIFNAGLRYEFLDTKAPYNPDLAGTVDSGVDENLVTSDPKHRFSPRLSLSFPITEQGIIRFSYGFFYQNPTFRSIYRNPRFEDFDFLVIPTFGNPNLKPQRSIQYEMGLQQQFTDDIKMDLTVFYKDVNDLLEDRRVIAGEVAIDKEFNVITNVSYASVKGFTAAFVKRRSPGGNFSATLDYTFQVGEGAFTDPNDLAVDTRTGRSTEQKFIPLDFDRTHTLNGTIAIGSGKSWLASAIGSVRGGTPYTPSLPSSVQAVEFDQNSERRPINHNVDFKFEKFFEVAATRMSVFVWVQNAFDTVNERFIHTNTGSSLTNLAEVTNPNLFNQLEETIMRSPENYFSTRFLENYYQREDWLAAPREVRLGLSFEF